MGGPGGILRGAGMDPAAKPAVIRVAALPISICPHAMSNSRPSRERARVSPVIACLDTVYGADRGRATWADSEPLLLSRPPPGECPAMRRDASPATRNGPVRCAGIICDQ